MLCKPSKETGYCLLSSCKDLELARSFPSWISTPSLLFLSDHVQSSLATVFFYLASLSPRAAIEVQRSSTPLATFSLRVQAALLTQVNLLASLWKVFKRLLDILIICWCHTLNSIPPFGRNVFFRASCIPHDGSSIWLGGAHGCGARNRSDSLDSCVDHLWTPEMLMSYCRNHAGFDVA